MAGLSPEDFARMKQDLKTEVSGEIARTITQGLNPNQEEPKYSWQQRGEDRPASPEELISETERIVKLNLTKEQELAAKEEEKRKAAIARQSAQNLENQFVKLERDGVLPALSKEAKERLAQGYKASEAATSDEERKIIEDRITLIQLANEMGETDVVSAYWKAKSMQTEVRKTAPVSAGTGTPQAPVAEGGYTYEELAGLPRV